MNSATLRIAVFLQIDKKGLGQGQISAVSLSACKKVRFSDVCEKITICFVQSIVTVVGLVSVSIHNHMKVKDP